MSQTKQDKQAEIAFSKLNFNAVEHSGQLSDRRRRLGHLEFTGLANIHNKLILDCGCGSGKDTAVLAGLGNNVVGTDLSYSALTLAKQTARNFGSSVTLIVADSECLPFRDVTFDVVCCFWTLHHFPSIIKVLSQLSAALKPSGRFVILEPNGSNIVIRASEAIEDLLRSWLIRTGVDTPNERIHNLNVYVSSLQGAGATNIQTKQWFSDELPPLPDKMLVRILVRIRKFLLTIVWHLFSEPMNGADFAILASKPGISQTKSSHN